MENDKVGRFMRHSVETGCVSCQ